MGVWLDTGWRWFYRCNETYMMGIGIGEIKGAAKCN
jgi:hypothetical protein